ncbi:MAG: endonuclease/exonuclease/phosphatase family protein [Spirochaetaceae bacterium]
MNRRTILRLGTFVALAVSMAACTTVTDGAAGRQSQDPETNHTMIVGTYNIRFDEYGSSGRRSWVRRREGVTSIIRVHNPDILLLQEVTTWDGVRLLPGRQIADIYSLLPEYSLVGAEHRERLESSNPILYRAARFTVEDTGVFYFCENPDNPYSYSWGTWSPRFSRWVRLYDRELQDHLYVFNVHLHPYLTRHKRQASRILVERVRMIAGDAPVILGGDFNSFPGSRQVRTIREELPMHDALRGSRNGTFHAFMGVSPWPRVDYVFASHHFAITGAEVAYHRYRGHYPSDHYPVFATLNPREYPPEGPVSRGEGEQ